MSIIHKVHDVDVPLLHTSIAGIISTTAIYPLDLVKTRLQMQKIGPQGQKIYKNITDCLHKSYKMNGFFGLYRGLFINALLIAPEKGIKWTCNDYISYKLASADYEISLPLEAIAGSLAGIAQSVITIPMELLKIRLQEADEVAAAIRKAQGKLPKQTTLIKTIKVLTERGIFGLYRGTWPTILREVTSAIIYLPLFDIFNEKAERYYHKNHNSEDADNIAEYMWYPFITTLSAACLSTFFVTPLDVIKTRLQYKNAVQYKSMTDCIKKTMKNEGFLGFFRGGLCRILSIPFPIAIVHTTQLILLHEKELKIEKEKQEASKQYIKEVKMKKQNNY